MSDLPYLAIPYKDESPRSILIRTAFHNGYSSITQLARRLDAPPSYSLQENLLGNSGLSKRFIDENPKFKDKIKSSFYNQVKGPTSNSPVIINNTQIPFSFLRTNGHFVCPDCLKNDGYIKQIHDINIVDICPIHKRFLRSTCGQCGVPLKWTYPETQSPCECKNSITQTHLADESSGAEFIQKSLENDNVELFAELKYILRALKFYAEDNVVERNKILNEAIKIVTDPTASLRQHLKNKKSQYSCLIIRVIATPFLMPGSNKISEICLGLLNEFPPEYSIKYNNCQCKNASLTLSEAAVCLEVTYDTLRKLSTYITPTLDSKTQKKTYSYKDLCHFFRSFYSKNNINLTVSESLSFTAPGKSIIEKIKQIKDGHLEILKSDQRKGLSGVFVPSFEYKTNLRVDEFSDLLTISEVSTYFNVYKDAVRNILNTGKLKSIVMRGTQPYFDIKQVEEFHNKYIFLKPLAEQIGMPKMKLKNNLERLGINKVASSSITSPLYSRADLGKIGRLKTHTEPNPQISSIRKKLAVKKKPLTINNAIQANNISLHLGIHIRLISKLEKYGLLQKVAYQNSHNSNSRYYSISSFKTATIWLGSAKTIEEFSDECHIHRAHFTKRYISNQFINPLRLNCITILISKKDQQKVIQHRKKYCTCSEADLFHNAPEKHFQNLVKTARIPSVEKSKLNYDFGTILLEWSVIKKYK